MLSRLLSRTMIPVAFGNGIKTIVAHAKLSTIDLGAVMISESPTKGVITLNRPKVLNAVDKEMLKHCVDGLIKFEKSKMLIIVKGAGDKSLSVGGDISSVLGYELEDRKNFFREVYTMDYLISKCRIPYIAFMDGLTMGGGVGLAVHGRYRVATERTVLAMPETAIGLFPDVGSSYFLSRLSGKLGLFLGLTGHRLKGQEVLTIGLATHFCESGKLEELESALLRCTDPNDVSDIINSLTAKCSKELSLGPHFKQINKYFSANSVEEIFENLERDGSEWALNTLATLKKMSPLSLKITFRQLEQGSKLSLAECLKMEFRIASRCLEKSDFQEGVRALIIDKDKKPKWNPPTLEGVSDDRVAEFFAKLPEAKELKL